MTCPCGSGTEKMRRKIEENSRNYSALSSLADSCIHQITPESSFGDNREYDKSPSTSNYNKFSSYGSSNSYSKNSGYKAADSVREIEPYN